MPIIVDHEDRRRAVISAAAALIAAGGVEAATVRAISRAAGYSTTIVSHYFSDKRALLLLTYKYAATRVAEIRDEFGPDASRQVRAFCVALLPRTAELRMIWRTWFAFWNMALTDAEFAAEQHLHALGARRTLSAIFARDQGFSGRPREWREAEAAEMLTLIMGVSLQTILNPADWPQERQIASVDARLRLLCEQPADPRPVSTLT